MFRRLCREAVIFMLLGLLFTSMGSFIYRHHTEGQRLPPCPPPPDFIALDKPAALPQTPQVTPPPDIINGYSCEDSINHRAMFVVTDAPAPKVKIDNVDLALTASFLGLYGFAGGLGAWLFYRLVRFAVKG
jgi:hypothetical protein